MIGPFRIVNGPYAGMTMVDAMRERREREMKLADAKFWFEKAQAEARARSVLETAEAGRLHKRYGAMWDRLNGEKGWIV